MAKRLWVAEVSFGFVVEAESETEAFEVAVDHAREDLKHRLFIRGVIDRVRALESLQALPDE